jgi:hypothetical protein
VSEGKFQGTRQFAAPMSQAVHAGSMESVMGSFGEAREAALTLREILPVLRARGLNLQQNFAELAPFRMPPYLFAGGIVAAFSFSRPFQAIVGRGDHKEEMRGTVMSVLQQADQVAWGFPLAGGAFRSNVLRGAIFEEARAHRMMSAVRLRLRKQANGDH